MVNYNNILEGEALNVQIFVVFTFSTVRYQLGLTNNLNYLHIGLLRNALLFR